ncbi:MAG: hypothetical protein COW32_10700 [Candidatus Aquicultor secundus]|nr:MAG: hypothetical protein COW32_10700 [Candidatus Aquicultor secundus]
MKAVSLNIFQDKKLIALAVESAVDKMKGVLLTRVRAVGESYPYSPDVPGVWVHGPDREGRYTVDIYVALAVSGTTIPEMANRLRAEIWEQLHKEGIDMADRVTSVDIYVEDLVLAV